VALIKRSDKSLYRLARGCFGLAGLVRAGREVDAKVKPLGSAGIITEVCNHTFRGTGITAYQENGGTLEKARQMAAHASNRTTQLYDRSEDRVMLEEVDQYSGVSQP
jgi:integrase